MVFSARELSIAIQRGSAASLVGILSMGTVDSDLSVVFICNILCSSCISYSLLLISKKKFLKLLSMHYII